MPERKRKTKKLPHLAGQAFLAKLGDAPIYGLKEVAAALYAANRSTQSRLRDILQSGDLTASVCWPDPNVVTALPKELWVDVKNEDFSVRERTERGWSLHDYLIKRPVLIRRLILPKLEQVRDSINIESSIPSHKPAARSAERETLEYAIQALRSGRAEAEVFVTASDATDFARRHFGSLELRGRGKPKTETEYINAALLEAFRLVHQSSAPLYQDALVLEMQKWWGARYPSRSETWIRNNIARPIWRALNLSL